MRIESQKQRKPRMLIKIFLTLAIMMMNRNQKLSKSSKTKEFLMKKMKIRLNLKSTMLNNMMS